MSRKSLATDRSAAAVVVAAIAGLAAVFGWWAGATGLNPYDTGVLIQNALFVRDGLVPNADFWSLYPGGAYVILAGWMAAFGEGTRAVFAFNAALFAALPFLAALLAREAGCRLAVCGLAALASWLAAWSVAGIAAYVPLLALECALATILLHAVAVRRRGLLMVAAAGVAAGVTAYVRHDFAVYLALGYLLTLWVRRRECSRGVESVFVVTALMTAGLAYGYTIWRGGFSDVLDQLVWFPLTVFPEYRGLPYPAGTSAMELALFYAVPILLLSCAVVIFRLRHAPGLLVWLALFALATLNQLSVRPDRYHAGPALILLAWVGVVVAAHCWPSRRAPARRTGLVATALFAPVLALGFLPALIGELSAAVPVATRFGPVYVGKDDPYRALIPYLQQRVAVGDVLYSGAADHDRLFVVDALLPVLLGARPAVASPEMHPGRADTAAGQVRIAAALKNHRVCWAVLLRTRGERGNRTSINKQIGRVDKTIRQLYRRQQSFGPYTVFQRRACARAAS